MGTAQPAYIAAADHKRRKALPCLAKGLSSKEPTLLRFSWRLRRELATGISAPSRRIRIFTAAQNRLGYPALSPVGQARKPGDVLIAIPT